LPHEHPKLAVAVTVDGNNDFGVQLDRAIARSKMIEAKPIIEGTATVSSASDPTRPVQTYGGGKPMIVDRRYRRW